MNDNRYVKFFCSDCGKWLGTMKQNAITSGIFPYCPRCKRQVNISAIQIYKNSAKCQQH